MKTGRKRTISAILAGLFLLLLVVPGCDHENTSEQNLPVYQVPKEPVTLRVVYDSNVFPGPQGMLKYLKEMGSAFEDAHENVRIVLEEYSEADPLAVDEFRTHLETEMANDEGPDLYLLSTGNTTSPYHQTPLFEDVNRAMREELFFDIGDYYDADRELTDGLNEAVMDAGVVNGFRYTLPIRFDYPVAAVNLKAFREAGLDESIFDRGINEVLYSIAQTGNPELAAAADLKLSACCLPFFADLIGYETEEVLVGKEELVNFLENWYPYHRLAAAAEIESGTASFQNYLADRQTWLQRGYPIHFCSLETVLQNTAFAKAEGIELGLYPLTGSDGRLVAEVAVYGAVGANCKHPTLAYEFLRQFLTEEVQWESDIPGFDISLDNMMFAGYPVRTAGSVPVYVRNLSRKAIAVVHSMPWLEPDLANPSSPVNLLSAVELSDEDVPVLQTEIDIVRYPIPVVEGIFGWEHTYRSPEEIPDAPDLDAAAADFLSQLEQLLQEN